MNQYESCLLLILPVVLFTASETAQWGNEDPPTPNDMENFQSFTPPEITQPADTVEATR